MTQQMKDDIMAIILPNCIKREENRTPYEAVWYAHRIICELEDKGYFQNNMISLNPEVFESYTGQL